MKNTKRIIIFMILLAFGIFLFGCTGAEKTGTGSNTTLFRTISQNPTTYSEALGLADSDNTKFVLRLSAGENNIPLSGTLRFPSASGTRTFRFKDFTVINRSDICDENGKEISTTVLVTFEASPVNETWHWDNVSYCNRTSFNPWVSEDQLSQIENPKTPIYTGLSSQVTLDPSKMALYLSAEYTGPAISGEMKFGSSNGSKSYSVNGTLLINRADLCDNKTSKYTNLTVTYYDSPINETRFWDNVTDVCTFTVYDIWIYKSDYEYIKNPTFNFTLYEYENKTGSPIDGNLSCNGIQIGTLQGGNVMVNKTLLLHEIEGIGGACKITISGLHQGHGFEFCGWIFNTSMYREYSYYDLNINRTIDAYYRRMPCGTVKSFITPNDPSVISRLRTYLPYQSQNLDNDIQDISTGLAKDYLYDYAEEQDVLNSVVRYKYPSEFLVSNTGVCADWVDIFLSLVLARDSNAPCYGVGVAFLYANGSTYEKESHATSICVINGQPKIYDQYQSYSGGSIWRDLFDSLNGENKFSSQGVISIKPFSYYNDKVYGEVDGVADLYKKLGVNG